MNLQGRIIALCNTDMTLFALDEEGNVWFRSLVGGVPQAGEWTLLHAGPEQASELATLQPAPPRPTARPAPAPAAPAPTRAAPPRAATPALAVAPRPAPPRATAPSRAAPRAAAPVALAPVAAPPDAPAPDLPPENRAGLEALAASMEASHPEIAARIRANFQIPATASEDEAQESDATAEPEPETAG